LLPKSATLLMRPKLLLLLESIPSPRGCGRRSLGRRTGGPRERVQRARQRNVQLWWLRIREEGGGDGGGGGIVVLSSSNLSNGERSIFSMSSSYTSE